MGKADMEPLRTKTSFDYFYISINSYNTSYKEFHLVLLLEKYSATATVSYKFFSSLPSESSIYGYSYNSLSYEQSRIEADVGTIYIYKLPFSSDDNYVVIRYSVSYSYVRIKGRSYFIENVPVNSNFDIELSTLSNTYNYFFTRAGYSYSENLYFNISDRYSELNSRIYYCLTFSNPEIYLPTSIGNFEPLDYYESKYRDSKTEYYYKININSYRGGYAVIKYNTASTHSMILAKSSYYDFSDQFSSVLDTIDIIFITLAGIAFVGIIITLICFCCQKKEINNLTNANNQPAVDAPTSSNPLIEK